MSIIKKTNNYILKVGESTLDKSVNPGVPCYQIINKEYGVAEIETFLFPQALKYLSDLQAGLDALNDQ